MSDFPGFRPDPDENDMPAQPVFRGEGFETNTKVPASNDIEKSEPAGNFQEADVLHSEVERRKALVTVESHLPAHLEALKHRQPVLPKPELNEDQDEDGEGTGFDFLKYISILIRHKKIVFLVVLSSLMVGIFKNIMEVKYYSTSAKLLLQKKSAEILFSGEYSYYVDKLNKLNTKLTIIQTRPVLERVIVKGNLPYTPGQVRNMFKTKLIKNTNVIEVTSTSLSPIEAQFLANALCEELIAYEKEVGRRNITEIVSYLERQVKNTKKDLEAKEDKIRDFKSKYPSVSANEELGSTEMGKYSNLKFELERTIISIAEATQRQISVKALLKEEVEYIPQNLQIDNTVQSLLDELNLDLLKAKAKFGLVHPKVKEIETNISLARAQLKKVGRVTRHNTLGLNPRRNSLLSDANNLRTELVALESKKSSLEKMVIALGVVIQNMPSKAIEYIRLRRDMESLENIFKSLQQRFEEKKIERETFISDLVLLERAPLNDSPISSGNNRSILIAILIGLVLGFAVAVLLENIDQTIKGPDDVLQKMKLPLLGVIPHVDFEHRILSSLDKSRLLEPYNALRTTMRYSSAKGLKRSFIITSAIQEEGKTTQAINLAISCALDGNKVLLIDADLRKSNLHKLLHLDKSPGLSEYLTEQSEFHEISHKTQFSNLYLIPAGERPPNPPEILGSSRLLTLLKESKENFDMIIFDSPALLPVSDALLIAHYVDSVICIVRMFKTPIKAALFLKTTLNKIGANITGVLLNGIPPSGFHARYSYYSYYGYKSYEYYETETREERQISLFKKFTATVLPLMADNVYKAKEIYKSLRLRFKLILLGIVLLLGAIMATFIVNRNQFKNDTVPFVQEVLLSSLLVRPFLKAYKEAVVSGDYLKITALYTDAYVLNKLGKPNLNWRINKENMLKNSKNSIISLKSIKITNLQTRKLKRDYLNKVKIEFDQSMNLNNVETRQKITFICVQNDRGWRITAEKIKPLTL